MASGLMSMSWLGSRSACCVAAAVIACASAAGTAAGQPVGSVRPILELQRIPTTGPFPFVNAANFVFVTGGVSLLAVSGDASVPVVPVADGVFGLPPFRAEASEAELLSSLAGASFEFSFDTASGTSVYGLSLGAAFGTIAPGDFPAPATGLFPPDDLFTPAPAGFTEATWTPPPLAGVDIVQASFTVFTTEGTPRVIEALGGNFAETALADLAPPGAAALPLSATSLPLPAFHAGFGLFAVDYFAFGPTLPLTLISGPPLEIEGGGVAVLISTQAIANFISQGGGAAGIETDINGDGVSDAADAIAHIVRLDASDPAADLDGNGELDVFDVLVFLAALDAA